MKKMAVAKAYGTLISLKDEITVEIMTEDRWIFGSISDAISFIELISHRKWFLIR
jgi:hypothetical protein